MRPIRTANTKKQKLITSNWSARVKYSADLFYNLGNVWFKLGDQGRAILNYQRALLLNPRLDEAESNLRTVLKIVGNDDQPTLRDQIGAYADYFPLVASIAFWIFAFSLFPALAQAWALRRYSGAGSASLPGSSFSAARPFPSGSVQDQKMRIELWSSIPRLISNMGRLSARVRWKAYRWENKSS